MSATQELINRLNAVLSWELAGSVQYLHHNAMLLGPERLSYADFFHEGSEEARDHAEAVAQKIRVLGGVPTVELATIRTASTLVDMFEAALSLERAALAAWEHALEVAGEVNQGTQFWIEEMVAHEQEHVDELVKLTGGVDTSGSQGAQGASNAG